jgi:hypothetical protein
MSGLFPVWPSVHSVLSASYIKKENPVFRADTETQLEKMKLIAVNQLLN